ncbi:ABC transporter permease [Nocardioides dongxiaopingii]|uniref:ABC transporter permease n=1 Tax=Nocardioides sp. S-1144 TaxID=2582905 RepID=UPI0011643475|nr:ABC transporter permease [Nocardioides sp. S-1144]QCW51394.2 ABC transporter permease [Nocardioides sp. S-1144]
MATTTPTTPTPGTAGTRPSGRAGRHPSATRRLVAAELRLLRRDPLTLTFVFVFPVISMLIIGGSFGTTPDDAFPVNPAHWYVASYFSVVIGATGLIMLPVHIASYRERGVLRRFAAAGFPRWSFALAELVLGLTAVATSGVVLLAVAAPVYGIPAVDDPVRVVLGVLLGAVTFVSLGVLLGSVLPSARAAQAVGMLLFFPSFLLGVGGPPPAVMSSTLRSISDVLPLKVVTDAVREPWLGLDGGTGGLVVVGVLAVLTTALAARRTAL